jgi:hypothetical protein
MFSIIATIFDVLVAIYTFPVHTWKGGCSDDSMPLTDTYYSTPYCETGYYSEPDKFYGATIGILLYGFTALILAYVFIQVWEEVQWRRHRKQCQHCGEWTVDHGTGSFPGCVENRACCETCFERHLDAEVEFRAATEPHIACPSCGAVMDKVIEHRVILDVCSCGAVFLSPEELEYLRDVAFENGYDDGHHAGKSAGSSNGALVGLMIGSSFN